MDSEAHTPPNAPLTAFLENHRILESRLFAVAFFSILLSMESRLVPHQRLA